VAAVEERVLLPRMHVKVNVHRYLPVCLSVLNVTFQSGDLWAEAAVECSPLAIHVKPIDTGPRVANYYSVDIDHRNNFEDVT
jgi:hypothetical protein